MRRRGPGSWIATLLRTGAGNVVLGVVVAATYLGPGARARLALTEGTPLWAGSNVPCAFLALSLPLFAATALFLSPWPAVRLAACALHMWVLLLAALTALAGALAVLTVILFIPGLLMILLGLVFAANSAGSVFIVMHDITAEAERMYA